MENKEQDRNDIPLSEEEIKILKASVNAEKVDRSKLPHYDNSDKAKLWRYIKKNKVFAAICAVLALCVAVTLILCVVFAVRKAMGGENKDDFTVILGDDRYTAKYKDIMRDGVLYVDMRRIADYTGLTVSGTKTSVKFTYDDNNYLRFENGSDSAVIIFS